MAPLTRNSTGQFTFPGLVYNCLNSIRNGATKWQILHLAKNICPDIPERRLTDRISNVLRRTKFIKNQRLVEVQGKWFLKDSYSDLPNVSSVNTSKKRGRPRKNGRYNISFSKLIEQFLNFMPDGGATKHEIQNFVQEFHPDKGKSKSYLASTAALTLKRQRLAKKPLFVEMGGKWFRSMINVDDTSKEGKKEENPQKISINEKIEKKSAENVFHAQECSNCSVKYETQSWETPSSSTPKELTASRTTDISSSASSFEPVIQNISSGLNINHRDLCANKGISTSIPNGTGDDPVKKEKKKFVTIDIILSSSDEEDENECTYVSSEFKQTIDLTTPTIDLTSDEEDETYKCPCCGDVFEDNEKLGKHVKIHSAYPNNCNLNLTTEELKFVLLLRERESSK